MTPRCFFRLSVVAVVGFIAVVTHAQCDFEPIGLDGVSSAQLETTVLKWKKQNPKASSDDLVCCLPSEWRRNYIVVPESRSLQCSAAKFPRIILFDPQRASGQPLTTALSFVGHKKGQSICNYKFSGVNNHDSLEILEFDPAKKPQDMFQMVHLDPSHEPARKVNPFVCVDCHGTPSGMKPYAYDLGAQFSNLGGLSTSCLTTAEKRQQKKWSNEFKNLALRKKQKPYSCLLDVEQNTNAPNGQGFEAKNAEFIRRLALSQNYHTAPRIRRSAEYAKYKYAIVAASLGCATRGASFSKFLPPQRSEHNDGGNVTAARAMTCQARDGICAKAVPGECRALLKDIETGLRSAQRQQPEEYAELLQQAYAESGRSAGSQPEQIEKFAQLQYLLKLQKTSAATGLDQLMREYPGPAAIDFQHLTEQLVSDDREFQFLRASSGGMKAAQPADCAKLQQAAQRAYSIDAPVAGVAEEPQGIE